MSVETPEVYTCEGCGSWTDRPVAKTDLLARSGPNAWGWVEAEDDGGRGSLYCPECQ
jgi:hypothetical protein